MLIDPESTAWGNLTLTVYNVPADFTSTITPGGDPVTVTTTIPGQNATLTFTGTINQRVFLRRTDGISGQIGLYCDVTATIRKPDGTTLASACMEDSDIIDTQTLPATGTYTIFVDPFSYATGNPTTGTLTLTLYDVPAEISGSITPGGDPVAVATTEPGQNGALTFTGTANQRVSVLGTNGTSGQIGLYCDVNVSLLRPNGSLQAAACMEGSGFIDVETLTTPGTYTLFVDPLSWIVGGVTLTLFDVPADVSGSVTIGGAALPVPIGTPGQNALITFAGTAMQQATVQFTGNTAGSVSVWLLRPSGSTLTATTSSESSFNLDTVTLPDTGTYSIVISPNGANTGTMNVSVTSP